MSAKVDMMGSPETHGLEKRLTLLGEAAELVYIFMFYNTFKSRSEDITL